MKDKKAREDIANLQSYIRRLDDLFIRSHDLEGVSIKDCPKCKHRVLVEATFKVVYSAESTVGLIRDDWEKIYQCLTCSTKFKCECKNVCEVIE